MYNEIMNKDKNKILIYTSDDGQLKVEVWIEDEIVWLTQRVMAELFDTTRNNITIHIKIYLKKENHKKKQIVSIPY